MVALCEIKYREKIFTICVGLSINSFPLYFLESNSLSNFDRYTVIIYNGVWKD